MRIVLISLEQQWLDKAGNFSRCREMAREADRRGCALAVYPEMTLTGRDKRYALYQRLFGAHAC